MDTKLRILLSQSLFGVAITFAWTPIVPYLVETYGILLTLAISIIAYAFTATTLYLFGIKGNVGKLIFIGALGRGLSFLAVFLPPMIGTPIIGIMIGLVIAFYWPLTNAVYHRELSTKDRGLFSTMVFAAWGIAKMVGPALGSWILASFGVAPLAAIGFGVMLLVGGTLLDFNENVVIRPSKERLKRSLERVVVLDGIWQGIHFIVPAVVTYLYLKNFVEFGITFSALAIISIAVSLLLGYKSVNTRKREIVFAYAFGLTGLASIALGVSNNFAQWVVFLAILSSIRQIKAPFLFALIGDSTENKFVSMTRRELLMEVGRVVGVALVIVLFLLGARIELAYAFVGIVMLLYSFKLKGFGIMKKAVKRGKEILMIDQKI